MTAQKRIASTAGPEPGPAGIPENQRPENAGRSKLFQHHIVDGAKCTIIVEVTATPHLTQPYRSDIEAIFRVRRGSRKTETLGRLDGSIIDKTFKRTPIARPAWQTDLLFVPPACTEDLRIHPLDDDAVSDVSRALLLLYTRRGEVRATVKQHSEALSHDKIHYISHFQLGTEFRSKGYAQIAMTLYLHTLGKLNNGFAFQGTIILSPAGIVEETEKMEARTGRIRHYNENVQALTRSYEKSGYTTWFRGNQKVLACMSIMGQVIPQPGTNLPISTTFVPEHRYKISPQEAESLKEELRPPDQSRTTKAAKESYYFHGTWYADIPGTDPSWRGAGKPGPRLVRHPHGLVDPKKEYDIRGIKDENDTMYLIEWANDPETGESYEDTWEPEHMVSEIAILHWKCNKDAPDFSDDSDSDN